MDRANDELGCMESCIGLYADVVHTPIDNMEPYVRSLMDEYIRYKNNYARNIKFDPTKETLGKDFHYSFPTRQRCVLNIDTFASER